MPPLPFSWALHQDVKNPWVAAFLLLDEHVESLVDHHPYLEHIILSGHIALTTLSIKALRKHARRIKSLGLVGCIGLDTTEGKKEFLSGAWDNLRYFEAPGTIHFQADLWELPSTRLCVPGRCTTAKSILEPQIGCPIIRDEQWIGHGIAIGSHEPWWSHRLVVDRHLQAETHGLVNVSNVHTARSTWDLAAPSMFLLHQGDFGV